MCCCHTTSTHKVCHHLMCALCVYICHILIKLLLRFLFGKKMFQQELNFLSTNYNLPTVSSILLIFIPSPIPLPSSFLLPSLSSPCYRQHCGWKAEDWFYLAMKFLFSLYIKVDINLNRSSTSSLMLLSLCRCVCIFHFMTYIHIQFVMSDFLNVCSDFILGQLQERCIVGSIVATYITCSQSLSQTTWEEESSLGMRQPFDSNMSSPRLMAKWGLSHPYTQ